jgi:hypothetical protein
MKVTLTGEAASALREFCGKLRERNELIGRSCSRVLSQLIISDNANTTPQSLELLAASLLTPEAKRKAMLKKLASLANELDAEMALKLLEKSVRKLDSSTSVKIEKDWEK